MCQEKWLEICWVATEWVQTCVKRAPSSFGQPLLLKPGDARLPAGFPLLWGWVSCVFCPALQCLQTENQIRGRWPSTLQSWSCTRIDGWADLEASLSQNVSWIWWILLLSLPFIAFFKICFCWPQLGFPGNRLAKEACLSWTEQICTLITTVKVNKTVRM